MNLAINYSSAAAQLVQAERIEIDYFKTPDWDWIFAEDRSLKPVTMHFTLEAGNYNLGEVDWNKVSELSQSTSTPFINLHLDARQKYYPDLKGDTRNSAEVGRVYETIFSDVMDVIK